MVAIRKTLAGLAGLMGGVSTAVLVALAPTDGRAATYAVFNPYVPTQSTFDRLQIRRLLTFGDSYSDPTFSTDRNWSEHLVAAGGISFYTPMAIQGATACNCVTNNVLNTFQQQLDAWFRKNITFQFRDLTVVYFGQNDINRLADLTKAKNDYTSGVDQLIADGALGGRRKILLTMVHNIARNPQHQPRAANNTTIWNQHVANVANARNGVIAVDLFTAFNRVFANPQQYGFTNVTTPNPSRSSIDALYFDGQHFGQKGQLLISQVFKHYLTRGWDWANTVQTGAQTVARLNADITAGRVFTPLNVGDDAPALSVVPIGALAQAEPTAAWDRPDWSRDGGQAFAEQTVDTAPDGGVGMSYRIDASTNLALLVGEYDETGGGDTAYGGQDSRTLSRSSGLVLDHRLGGLQLTTTFLYSDDQHSLSTHDSFVDRTMHADYGGDTMRLGQRFGYDMAAPGATVTPWLEVSWQRQSIDDFTMADPYVSDVHYQASSVEETALALGIAAESQPIRVGDHGSLRLFGGVGYTHSLAMDDYQVAMTESATGYTQREEVERENLRSLDMSFGAAWDVNPALALNAGYRLDTPVGGGSVYATEHQVTAGLRFRF